MGLATGALNRGHIKACVHACHHNDLVAKSNSAAPLISHQQSERESDYGKFLSSALSLLHRSSSFLLHHIRQRTAASTTATARTATAAATARSETLLPPVGDRRVMSVEYGQKRHLHPSLPLHRSSSYFQFPFCANKTGSVPDHLSLLLLHGRHFLY